MAARGRHPKPGARRPPTGEAHDRYPGRDARRARGAETQGNHPKSYARSSAGEAHERHRKPGDRSPERDAHERHPGRDARRARGAETQGGHTKGYARSSAGEAHERDPKPGGRAPEREAHERYPKHGARPPASEARRRPKPDDRRPRGNEVRDRGAPAGEGERLQKVLARLGVASRREAEEWIRAGRITVNGAVAVLGTRVGRSDRLRLDGRLIHRHEIAAGQVYLCHRSPGENLRTPDEPSEHQALVERLPRRAGNRFITVSPMPRIDGGLELVTSDGELAATLQRLVHRLASEFSVRVRGELNEMQLRGILEGTLDRGARLQVESCEPSGGEGANRWYTLVARGGSGKDVRQLFERQGALVSRVLRVRVGPIELDRHLSRGQFRPLTKDEIESLRSPPAQA